MEEGVDKKEKTGFPQVRKFSRPETKGEEKKRGS